MKAKELLSPHFDPHQPLPSTINLGWSAIEKQFLNHHNRYLYPGHEKGGEVTPCFEDEGITAIFSAIQVHLNDDDLQPERDLYYNPESYLQFLTKFLNKRLEPAGRSIQSIKWHFTDGMPFIYLRLTNAPAQRPAPSEQAIPVPAKKPQSKLEERFARYYAEHEAMETEIIPKKSRVMEEYEAVFGPGGTRAQAQMA